MVGILSPVSLRGLGRSIWLPSLQQIRQDVGSGWSDSLLHEEGEPCQQNVTDRTNKTIRYTLQLCYVELLSAKTTPVRRDGAVLLWVRKCTSSGGYGRTIHAPLDPARTSAIHAAQKNLHQRVPCAVMRIGVWVTLSRLCYGHDAGSASTGSVSIPARRKVH
jgi:hypothetical protein